MSLIYITIVCVALAVACVISWQAALRWNNRTRDANAEDPRDQEIRELSAALSVARKEVDRLKNTSGDQDSQLGELREKLEQATETLNDTQQKYAATQETLNKEIEEKGGLLDDIAKHTRELEATKARLAELELQSRMDAPGSGMVAGLDDVIPDDEKEVYTIRQEHRELKQRVEQLSSELTEQSEEVDRWKQHCQVMSKTNKTLRGQLDELSDSQSRIDSLQSDVDSLTQQRDAQQAANTELEKSFADAKAGLEQELTAAREDSERQLTDVRAELGAAQEREDKLREQLKELDTLREDNQQMRQQLDALAEIEADNQKLMSDLRDIRQTSETRAAEIESERDEARAQAADLQKRVEALDQIQAENDRLSAQLKEMRQLRTERDQLARDTEDLRKKIAGLNDARTQDLSANEALEAQLRELKQQQSQQLAELETLRGNTAELQTAREDNEKLRKQAAVLKSALDQTQNAKNQLNQDLNELSQSRDQLETERSTLSGDLNGAREEIECLQKLLDEQSETLEAARSDLESAQSELATAREDASAAQDELASAQTELRARTDEVESKDAELKTEREQQERLQGRVDELEQALNESMAETAEARLTAEEQLERERDETQALQARIDKLRQEVEAHRSAPAAFDAVTEPEPEVTSANDDERPASTENTDSLPALSEADVAQLADDDCDDLQQIKGVGAKLEQKLNMLGIVSYRGLIELTPDDMERAQELIPSFKSRINRDGWVDQARELHRAKYSEAL